jgi:hypothetical protein
MRVETDIKNYRLGLGQLVEDLKRLAEERNVALVTAHQSNREGARAGQVKGYHIGEDWSIMQTADYLLTMSRNEHEKVAKLARISAEKARGVEDGLSIVVGQNYHHGQFAIGRAAYALAAEDYKKFVSDCVARVNRARKRPNAGALVGLDDE